MRQIFRETATPLCGVAVLSNALLIPVMRTALDDLYDIASWIVPPVFSISAAL